MLNYIQRLYATWHPDQYHGWGKTRNFFEGWYFKLVNADESEALAFIPGISMKANGEKHAFIQVMDGARRHSEYHQFHVGEFRPESRRFHLNLGQNAFSASEIRLQLPEIQGSVQFSNLQTWPKMFGAPGIMGWFSFVPFMECFHGIVSLNHELQGQLSYKNQQIRFDGGKGYIEKDWGRSFPRAYVWLQSNHFDTSAQASLIASVAHIPWLKDHFIGYISGFWLEGRLFRFATYTGAKKHLSIQNQYLELIFKSATQEIRIRAQQAPGVTLISPISGEMVGKINESLKATLEVELFERGRRIFEGRSKTTGLELAGDLDVLVNS